MISDTYLGAGKIFLDWERENCANMRFLIDYLKKKDTHAVIPVITNSNMRFSYLLIAIALLLTCEHEGASPILEKSIAKNKTIQGQDNITECSTCIEGLSSKSQRLFNTVLSFYQRELTNDKRRYMMTFIYKKPRGNGYSKRHFRLRRWNFRYRAAAERLFFWVQLDEEGNLDKMIAAVVPDLPHITQALDEWLRNEQAKPQLSDPTVTECEKEWV